MRRMTTYGLTFVAFFIFLAVARQAQGANAATAESVLASPRATQRAFTATPQPTRTVNFQATAQIAQATADEARRVNTQATVVFYQAQQAQIDATSQAEQFHQQKLSWTATAQGTSIPLTATAQMINSTAIARQQNLLVAQMTATAEAPSKMLEMKSAEAYNATIAFYIEMWMKAMVGVFMLAVPVLLYLLRLEIRKQQPRHIEPREAKPTPQAVPAPQEETVIRVVQEQAHGAYPKMDRLVVPCAVEKFDALVNGVLGEGLALTFSNFVGAGKAFTTNEKFAVVRNWMQSNRLAQSAGNGGLILTADGESLFIEWLNNRQLPEHYSFDEVKA